MEAPIVLMQRLDVQLAGQRMLRPDVRLAQQVVQPPAHIVEDSDIGPAVGRVGERAVGQGVERPEVDNTGKWCRRAHRFLCHTRKAMNSTSMCHGALYAAPDMLSLHRLRHCVYEVL